MRALAVIAFLALAFPGRAEMDALSVSCSAAPSLPSPVLVVYGSEEPGSAEARWLKALQPGTEERRALMNMCVTCSLSRFPDILP
ncbi:MAG: hypothetical protein ACLRPT_11560 [Akkermansia muciniphila]